MTAVISDIREAREPTRLSSRCRNGAHDTPERRRVGRGYCYGDRREHLIRGAMVALPPRIKASP